MPASLRPVIVGAGQIVDRPASPLAAVTPAGLMAEALRRADADTGGSSLLPALDSLDIVHSVTGSRLDLAGDLPGLIGAHPRRIVRGPVGGESPVRLIHEAANRIARGEAAVAAVCGAEAAHAAAAAAKAGLTLPWAGQGFDWDALLDNSRQNPLAVALGVAEPATVYPFFENAGVAAAGLSPAAAHRQSAELWAAYARVAADNPIAWLRTAPSAGEIARPTEKNRRIAYPYPKLMVANPLVNQGAAILLTSLDRARAAGIPDDRIIYLRTGAAANDPVDYLNRDQFVRSHAMDAVLGHCRNGSGPFDLVELYSCFPCVPKMARQVLDLDVDVVPTVTGGLTFHGAPLNTYMTHAAACMVMALRRRGRGQGLLYGQGEFVTKHHALVLATADDPGVRWPQSGSVQAAADAASGPVPVFVSAPSGQASLVSFTVLYRRDGSVSHGVVILRLENGTRTLARVPATDTATLACLTDPQRSPVGTIGPVCVAPDGIPEWCQA